MSYRHNYVNSSIYQYPLQKDVHRYNYVIHSCNNVTFEQLGGGGYGNTWNLPNLQNYTYIHPETEPFLRMRILQGYIVKYGLAFLLFCSVQCTYFKVPIHCTDLHISTVFAVKGIQKALHLRHLEFSIKSVDFLRRSIFTKKVKGLSVRNVPLN